MFARVHISTEVKGGNSGSCYKLAKYLDKEAEQENVKGETVAERETSSRLVHYLDKEEGNNFFSSQPGKYDMGEVMTNIDGNVKNLRMDDTKFYMLTLNPSVDEQKHLIGKDIDDFHSLSKEEQDAVKQKLVQFTRASMDAYAQNFHREGINCGDDLLYYARIETQRTYKKDSEEVRVGKVKAGTLKPGLNLHVHIIVSRNSKDQTRKLSPHAKSRGNSWVLNGNTVNRGFDHEKWKVDVQEIFNNKFSYKSSEKETYIPNEYQVIEKPVVPDKNATFKEWFGTYNSPGQVSKVVDSWGVPIKVYHSTVREKEKNKFETFNTEKPAWFTPSIEYSKIYSRKKKGKHKDTYTVYLNLKNPLNVGNIDRPFNLNWFEQNDWFKELSINSGIPFDVIEERLKDVEGTYIYNITNTKEFKELLLDYGFDGMKATERGFTSYAAFYPEQIRNASEVHFRKKDYILPQQISEKPIVDLEERKLSEIREKRNMKTQPEPENKVQDYQKYKEQSKKESLRVSFDPDKVIGTVTYLNKFGVDTVSYNDKKDFIEALGRNFKEKDAAAWSFEVVDKNPDLRKAVDDIFCKSRGENNDVSKEWYTDNKGFCKVNPQEFKLKEYVGGIVLNKENPEKYTYFVDKKEFVDTLRKSIEKGTWIEYKIFSMDPGVRKPIDDMLAASYGLKNKMTEEKYEEIKNWRIEKYRGKMYCSAIPVKTVNREKLDLRVEQYMKDRQTKSKSYDVKNNGNKKRASIGSSSIPGMNKIKQKVKKEIIQDNFQTERLIIGKTSMVVRTMKNPVSSVKQAIISEIKNMLNPVKEL